MQNDYKIVYTVSNIRDLMRDTITSLRSLRRFVDKENIIIYYTPPRSNKRLETLNELGIVEFVNNLTKPFWFMNSRGFIRGGEKIHLCNVDAENIIFLDCDTVINKNILDLLDGDYDFYGRYEEIAMREFDMNKWDKMFRKFDKKQNVMFNTGFMIFKNNTHKKIREDLLKFMNINLPQCHPRTYQKDQYAFALALSGYSIRYMDSNKHAFRWDNEENIDSYVLHGTKLSLMTQLYIFQRRIIKGGMRRVRENLRKAGLI